MTGVHLRSAALFALGIVALSGPAAAEPYLAVHKGLKCSACHSQPAGGGRRNAYGNVFAQTELAAARIGDRDLWTGALTEWLAVGSDLRGRYEVVDRPDAETRNRFDLTRGTIYLEATLIPDRLSIYVDQQVAPNASINREAYVKLDGQSGKMHVIAGQFYLPYGLRLQDDTAFVRQATGINFTTPDRGVQFGYESDRWSTQISVTNGSGGGDEIDSGKQFSAVTAFVRPRWRVGASINVNDADAGDRRMANVFFGLRTGPVVWLGEADWIEDELPGAPDRDRIAALVEGNWLFARGHNLKVTYEYFDPDRSISEDHRVRYSVLWEYTPIQFLQSRLGIRLNDGPPQRPAENTERVFLELHGFF